MWPGRAPAYSACRCPGWATTTHKKFVQHVRPSTQAQSRARQQPRRRNRAASCIPSLYISVVRVYGYERESTNVHVQRGIMCVDVCRESARCTVLWPTVIYRHVISGSSPGSKLYQSSMWPSGLDCGRGLTTSHMSWRVGSEALPTETPPPDDLRLRPQPPQPSPFEVACSCRDALVFSCLLSPEPLLGSVRPPPLSLSAFATVAPLLTKSGRPTVQSSNDLDQPARA